MQYKNRWKEIKPIGEGGQGKVIRVLDKHKVKLDPSAILSFIEIAMKSRGQQQTVELAEEQIQEELAKIVHAENPINHGALKILHSPNEARNFEAAEERLKRELDAMKQAHHPNLLKILDHDLQDKWFVSKYYPNGTLQNNSRWFTGQVERTLTAIRPIVSGLPTCTISNSSIATSSLREHLHRREGTTSTRRLWPRVFRECGTHAASAALTKTWVVPTGCHHGLHVCG